MKSQVRGIRIIHIVKKYKHIVESMESQDIQYDNLYMDSNSIIYDMLHSMESMQSDDDFEIKYLSPFPTF